MIASLSRPFIVVAAIGWVASIVVSALSLVGVSVPDSAALVLFVGVFPLWLCTVLLLQRQMSVARTGFSWATAFRECPQWVRYAIWATWGYGVLSFFLIGGGPFQAKGAGFIAVFYATSLGVFVTTWVTRSEPTECANGHRIGPVDKFCSDCGVEIKRTNSVPLVS